MGASRCKTMWFEKNLGNVTLAKREAEENNKRKEISCFITDKKLKALKQSNKLIHRFGTNPKKTKPASKKNCKLNKCFYCCRLLLVMC